MPNKKQARNKDFKGKFTFSLTWLVHNKKKQFSRELFFQLQDVNNNILPSIQNLMMCLLHNVVLLRDITCSRLKAYVHLIQVILFYCRKFKNTENRKIPYYFDYKWFKMYSFLYTNLYHFYYFKVMHQSTDYLAL